MDASKVLCTKMNLVPVLFLCMLHLGQTIAGMEEMFIPQMFYHDDHDHDHDHSHGPDKKGFGFFPERPHRRESKPFFPKLPRRGLMNSDGNTSPNASACVSVYPVLCKFVDALPIPTAIDVSTGNIQVIGAYKIKHKLHRDLPSTPMYGYGTSAETASSPGPTLEAKYNVTTRIQWENHLDGQELLQIDPTLVWANPKDGSIPIVTHLHGSASESTSDGHPEAWFTFLGEKGPTYNKSLYTYLNNQQPAGLWYHDHTIGITRIHVYSGLAGLYFIRSPDSFRLPSDKYEIPLVLQDKFCFADGSLSYPTAGVVPPVHPYWVPGAAQEYNLVNGKVWPYLKVEKRRYRFRLLNAANGRFYQLRFSAVQAGSGYGNGPVTPLGTLPAGSLNLTFHQIGTDAGYLSTPMAIDQLLMAPGERADIVVDFSKLSPNQTWEVFLTNTAASPFSTVGIPPDSNSIVLMKFIVQTEDNSVDSSELPQKLTYIPPLDTSNVVKTRYITMAQEYDTVTGGSVGLNLDGVPFSAPATETPKSGTTEVWTIINLNNNPHPMHVHLVRHRILSRKVFDPYAFLNRNCSFTDPDLPTCWIGEDVSLAPGESGWKDTSVALPYMTTSILLKFAEESERMFPFNVSEAPGYVWHCHILEHEDNELMRPLIILP